MTWPLVNLSVAAEVNPRSREWVNLPPDTPVGFVPMAAVSEETASIQRVEERPLGSVRKGFTPFKDEDVLFAKITPCMENGKAALARGLPNGIGFGSTEFHVLRARPGVIPEYLYYFIRQSSFRASAKTRFRGAVGQQRVPENFLAAYPFPLPALTEQRRIVELLEQADGLRRKRAVADALADRVLPALFLKLFGDPARNSRSLPTEKMERLAQVKRGDFRHRPRTEPRFYGGPYPFIQINDITASSIIIRTHSQTLNEEGLAISRMFPAETVVVSIAATIAASGILGFDSCFPDSLVGVRSRDKRTTQEYLLFYLRLMAAHLARIAPQLAQKNINLEILNALDVPVPQPHSLQLFTAAVKRFVAVEQRMASSHEMLHELWRTVLHRAFSGELTAKWREAHMKELLAEMEQQARLLEPPPEE